MNWEGEEWIFHVQPAYVGNFFEIVNPDDESDSYFTDELQYVHAHDFEPHYCIIMTIPFTTRRGFLDYKQGGGSPSLRGYLHFANYQLQNICATIDETTHDCSFH